MTKRYADKFSEGAVFDAHDLMMRVARDIIVETMFSDQPSADTLELDAAFAELERYVCALCVSDFIWPWSRCRLCLPVKLELRSA